MGFFNKDAMPAGGSPGLLMPLSKERVKAALERAGWSYSVDSDGDIGGGWEYGFFYFFLNGAEQELLCIRGTWRGRLAEADWQRCLELCNAWNADKLWPKTYCRRDDEGAVYLHTELSVDYEHGVSDEQIDQQLMCGINTSMMFFEHVNEQFPAVWEQYRPEA